MNQRQMRPAGVLGFVHSLAERVLGAVLRVETIKRGADLVCLLENLIVQRRRQSHGRLKRSLPKASLAGGAGCRAAGRRRSRGAGDDSPSAMPTRTVSDARAATLLPGAHERALPGANVTATFNHLLVCLPCLFRFPKEKACVFFWFYFLAAAVPVVLRKVSPVLSASISDLLSE